MFTLITSSFFSILSSTPPHELPLYEPKIIDFVIYYKYLCHCSFVETLTLLLKPARATASPFPEGRDLGCGVLNFERVTDLELAELESWNKTESRMMDKYNSEKEVQLQPRAAMCENIK